MTKDKSRPTYKYKRNSSNRPYCIKKKPRASSKKNTVSFKKLIKDVFISEITLNKLSTFLNIILSFFALWAYVSISPVIADYQGIGVFHRAISIIFPIITFIILVKLFIFLNPLISPAYSLLYSKCINPLQKLSRKKKYLISFLIFMAVVGCFIASRYVRHTYYYRNVAEIYGLPVGIGENINPTERETLANYWIIQDYYFVKKIKLEYVNGYSQTELLKKYSSLYSLSFFELPAKIEYSYVNDEPRFQKLSQDSYIAAKNNNFRAAEKITYYTSNNKVLIVMEMDENWNCKILDYSVDDKAQIINSTIFKNPNGSTIEKNLVSQIHQTYNTNGLVEARMIKTLNNNASFNLYGICGEKYTYDKNNRLVSLCYLDMYGNPVLNKLGIMCITFDYTEKGNISGVKYYKDETLSEKAEGFNGVFYEKSFYDTDNNLYRREMLDRNESKSYDKNGVSAYIYEYDNDYLLSKEMFNSSTGKEIRVKKLNSSSISFTRNKDALSPTIIIGFDSYTSNNALPEDMKDIISELTNYPMQIRIPTENENNYSALNADERLAPAFKSMEYLPDVSDAGDSKYASEEKRNYSHISYKIGKNNEIAEEAYYSLENILVLNERNFAICKYTYDIRGNICNMAYFDTDENRTVNSDGYSAINTEYDEEGKRKKVTYLDINEKPTIHFKNGYASILYDYRPMQGQMEQVTENYQDASGEPCIKKDGRYAGMLKLYDERGRLIKTSYMAADGAPTTDSKMGVAELLYEYSDTGNISREWYKNPNGDTVSRGDLGFAIVKREYNDYGDIIEEQYFDSNEKPAYYKGRGNSIVAFTYNDKRQIIRTSYLDADYKPILRKDTGFSVLVQGYDEYGNTSNELYYDTTGKPALYTGRGYASVLVKYENGNWVEERYFGADGELTSREDKGYAIIKNEYNDDAQRTKQSYFVTDEVPAISKDYGYASYEMSYDERGNVIEYRYKGIDGSLTLRTDVGFAVLQCEYDSFGNTTGERYFDTDLKPALHISRGYASYMDVIENGNLMESRFYGKDGELTLRTDTGYAIVKYEYDNKNQRRKQSYFNAEEVPTLYKGYGNSSVEMIYDKRGNVAEYHYYDTTGQLTELTSTGYAVVRCEYDSYGNITGEQYFDSDEKPTLYANHGYASFVDVYENGKCIENRYYGKDGELTLCIDNGYAVAKYEYDNFGNTIKGQYFDTKGNPAPYAGEGYASFRNIYKDGNWIEGRYYGVDGELAMRTDEGYAIVKNEYNDKKQMTKQSYFDIHGVPTPFKGRGYASVEMSDYDERGNVRERRFKDADGQLIMRADTGYAVVERDYDISGKIIGERYFDTEENPTLYTGRGYASYTEVYENGNWVEARYYGINGKLAPRADDGYAIIRSVYNDRNKRIEQSYFDQYEAPTLYKGRGYAKVELDYDENDNKKEDRFYDKDGQLTLRTDTNVAVIKYEYDRFNRKTGEQYLNTDMEPVLYNGRGYASFVDIYEDGNCVESRYYGIDGELTIRSDINCAITRRTYNDKNQLTAQSYFDINNMPAFYKNGGYSSMEMDYDERGKVVEYRYKDADGDLTLRTDTGYAVLIYEYDSYGVKTGERYLDTRREPSAHIGNGYASYVDVYENGKWVESRYYGKDGELTNRSDTGYSIIRSEYNNKGQRIKQSYFDTHDMPVSYKDRGYSTIEIYYDEKWNEREHRYKDRYDQLMTRIDTGYAIAKYEHDDYGNKIKYDYFNADKEPALCTEGGYASRVNIYENGNIVESSYYGITGDLIPRTDTGYATIRIVYDEKNQWTKESFYDVKGNRIKNKEGGYAFRIRVTHTDSSKTIFYYDEEENLTLRTDTGYAAILNMYDDYGHEIRGYFYDTEIEPALYKDRGYASYSCTYKDGLRTEIRYYDKDGHLTNRIDEGHAIAKFEYNKKGQEIKQSFFNADGSPAQFKNNGYSSAETDYDDRGNKTEHRYYNIDGQLAPRTDRGYAVAKFEYNDYGNAFRGQYYDADGNPALYTGRGYASYLDIYENGRLVKSEFYDVNGELTERTD